MGDYTIIPVVSADNASACGRNAESSIIEPTTAITCSIQHFCYHDGPGIRSVVYLKGCPLSCAWCQNPESISQTPQLAFKTHLCIENCTRCMDVCPTFAMYEKGVWRESDCTHCNKCVDACPSGAMTLYGDTMTIDAVMQELRNEFSLYRSSGGGVTFSGGEATLQPKVIYAINKQLKSADIHSAIETSGHFRIPAGLSAEVVAHTRQHLFDSDDAPALWKILLGLDLVFFDLKLFDSEQHQAYCGVHNRFILSNFKTLVAWHKEGLAPMIWPRIPLIPKVTDTVENLQAIAQFILSVGLQDVTLLPYHPLGNSKREWLNLPTFAADEKMYSEQALQSARDCIEAIGVRTHLTGEEVI